MRVGDRLTPCVIVNCLNSLEFANGSEGPIQIHTVEVTSSNLVAPIALLPRLVGAFLVGCD